MATMGYLKNEDFIEINSVKRIIEDETIDNNILKIRENLLEDIKKDTKALYYAIKYLDPNLNILTIEFFEQIVETKKFAIQYIPNDCITDKMIWTIIKGKNPRHLVHIPNDRITKEMENAIIDTFKMPGLQSYLRYMGERLSLESVKRIILKTRKDYRFYLSKYIPEEFLIDEIKELVCPGWSKQ